MRIDVRKLNNTVYEASTGGEVLCRSKTPLLSAARVLMRRGVDPNTELRMVRLGSETILMRARLGDAAALTVIEKDKAGPRFGKFREFPDLEG
jgi:hypothetical protein